MKRLKSPKPTRSIRNPITWDWRSSWRPPAAKEVAFRYQLTGPHGLPIEGQWYANSIRNVFIGQVDDKGNVERTLQDLREIGHKEGGEEVTRGDKPIRYAMVANQFFTSGIAVATRDQENRTSSPKSGRSCWTAATKV